MKRLVRVTKEDLTGHYRSNTDCPVARALKRAFPEWEDSICVGGESFALDETKRTWKIFSDISPRLSSATMEIARGEGRPFWFRVEEPSVKVPDC
jgi:hypothetical protein